MKPNACKRCGGDGLRFPKVVTTPDGKVPHPLYSEGARCVPCGGTGKAERS